MNEADSSRLARALENLGYDRSSSPEDADVIVLNTCVVRRSAEDKALGRLSSIQPLKKARPERVIALMGCLVGVQGNPALQKRFPWVDVFSAPSDPQPLLDFLVRRADQPQAQAWRERADEALDAEFGLSAPGQAARVSENLPIVLGCSHACAYCVIPSRRGRERSRDAQKILSEARSLAQSGAREVVLLGQIVDRYGLDLIDGPRLPELLSGVASVPGILRVRFLTSHPNWMTSELLQSVAANPKVMPHIEVPIQAGDDEVLTAMRRGYTQSQYRELIAQIRETIPGVSIGTDIIVGFPGESEAAFLRTYDLLADLKLDVAHLARYSARPNTYSARFLADDVPNEEKMRRFRALEDLQERLVAEINARYLGQRLPVLFEGRSKQRWFGRTPTNRLVFVESEDDLVGRQEMVTINWTGPWSLIGQLADPA